jgi:hypothetical protein
MLYSEMTAEQRSQLLDDPDNYPLRGSFLEKTGLLTPEVVRLLIDRGTDFEVDDRQVASVLGPEATVAAGGAAGALVSATSKALAGILVARALFRRQPPDERR